MRLRVTIAVLITLSTGQARARETSACACVTVTTPAGRRCALGPGQGQRAVLSVPLPSGQACTQELCEQMYREQAGQANEPSRRFPYTCNRIVVEPETVAELVECSPSKPTLFNLSLDQEFDNSTATDVPLSYNPLKLDINRCEVGRVGQVVEDYIRSLKAKGCSCKNLVMNINSHGLTQNGSHTTQCLQVDGARRHHVALNSKALYLELSQRLKAEGCDESVFVFDSCFSGQLMADLSSTRLAYPVLATSHRECVAPGDSNVWRNFQSWCRRCDTNRNRTVTLEELRNCLPRAEYEIVPVLNKGRIYQMSITDGPWAMTSAADADLRSTVFKCEGYGPTIPRQSGLSLRGRQDNVLVPVH